MLGWLDVVVPLICLAVYVLDVFVGVALWVTVGGPLSLVVLILGLVLPAVVFIGWRLARSRGAQARDTLHAWVRPDRSRRAAWIAGVGIAGIEAVVVWAIWPRFPAQVIVLPPLLGAALVRIWLRPARPLAPTGRIDAALVLAPVLGLIVLSTWVTGDLVFGVGGGGLLAVAGMAWHRRRLRAAAREGDLERVRALLVHPVFGRSVPDVIRAEHALDLGELDAAETLLHDGLAWLPRTTWGRGLAVLGAVRLRQGRPEEAEALGEASARVAPHQPWGYGVWAEARMTRGAFDDDTAALLERALDLGVRQLRTEPPLDRWRRGLAWLWAARGQPERAERRSASVVGGP